MASRALVILLALFLLILPILSTDHSAQTPTTPTSPEATTEATEAATVTATLEITEMVTAEATEAATEVLLPTAEVTEALSMTPTLEITHEVTIEATAEITAVASATAEPTAEATGDTSRFPSQALMGDPVHGQAIFDDGLNGAPACINCHGINAVGRVGFALGPGLKGIADIAGERIEGLSAQVYIEDSIRYPNDFITPGFRGIMYGNFAEDYSDQDIADLIAYLMTLRLVPEANVPAAE
jgi:mono/diheme cytochrome c family protein